MKITFHTAGRVEAGAFVVLVAEGRLLGTITQGMDNAQGGLISKMLQATKFEGKKNETLTLPAPDGRHFVLVGVGQATKVNALQVEMAGGVAVGALNALGVKHATVVVDSFAGSVLQPADVAAHMAHGAHLGSYRFDKYRTNQKPSDKPSLVSLGLMLDDAEQAQNLFQPLRAIGEGVVFARDLGNEPPNVLYPQSFAERVQALRDLGLEVEVLGREALQKLNMNTMLAVAQGSIREPQLVIMKWQGGKAGEAPVALVGKGVTFDTGGISIKPSDKMWDMKYDMMGAAAVAGTMLALAARKAKVNVIGLCGLVENMPSGAAYRPADVIVSASGKTVEILNTDAEGRLVLCDVLHYAQETFKPRAMVDLATLTGAVIVALGYEYAGVLGHDDALINQLIAAGEKVDEKLWRLPLGESYANDLKSDIADIKHTSMSRSAGTIEGGQFLAAFVKEGTPWAHLDIAAMMDERKGKPICPKGAMGYGVRLLNRWLTDVYGA